MAIASNIENNSHLRFLNLKNNAIGNAGINQFVKSIQHHNKVIQKINLDLNPVDFRIIEELKLLFNRNAKENKKLITPGFKNEIHRMARTEQLLEDTKRQILK